MYFKPSMPFHHTTVWLILFDSWSAGWGPLSTLVLLKVFETLFRIISAYCGHIRINLIEPTVFSVHKPGISLFKVIFKRSSLYEIVGPKFKTKFDLYTVAHLYARSCTVLFVFFCPIRKHVFFSETRHETNKIPDKMLKKLNAGLAQNLIWQLDCNFDDVKYWALKKIAPKSLVLNDLFRSLRDLQ